MRALGISIVTLIAVGLSACGGGGDSEPTPQNFVSAEAAMAASAESYQSRVESFEGTMSIGFGAGAESLSTSGDMKFVAPDQVYFSMNIPGFDDVEVLLTGDDIYFNVHGTWYRGSGAALGINLDDFRKYMEDRGPIDYVAATKGLKDLVKLSDEQIDGKAYWHYHAALDLNALSEGLPADLSDPALLRQVADAVSGATMEIYIDPETVLPRRYTMELAMTIGDAPQSFSMNMQMDFLKYNADVNMPDVPENAQPFEGRDLGSGTS
jgi:outer membrane lipoprotein-sorting protein